MLIKLVPYLVQISASLIEIRGAFLLYKYAMPPHVIRHSGTFVGTGENFMKEVEINKLYDKKSKNGWRFLLMGFFLQSFYAFGCIVNLCI